VLDEEAVAEKNKFHQSNAWRMDNQLPTIIHPRAEAAMHSKDAALEQLAEALLRRDLDALLLESYEKDYLVQIAGSVLQQPKRANPLLGIVGGQEGGGYGFDQQGNFSTGHAVN